MSERPRKKGGAGKFVAVILLLLLVLICTTGFMYYQNLGYPYKPKSVRYEDVEVPDGMAAASLGNLLEKKDIIRFSHDFYIYSRIHGLSSKYQAGKYLLSPSMSMAEIAEILSSGKVNAVKLTVTEGSTKEAVGLSMVDKGFTEKDKLEELFSISKYKDDYGFLKKLDSIEGYLTPNTYDVQAGEKADGVIKQMLDEHRNVFTEDIIALAKKLKSSEQEIMIIASIIEKECASEDDYRTVSGVIYNRLKKDMPLQMDSTVQYVLELDGQRKDEDQVTIQDTEIESPYNTYKYKGLPPGPICSPGKKAIEAAVKPEKTDYLYFVLSDKLDGTFKYSSKYTEFEKDKQAYYDAVASQEDQN